MSDSVTHYFKEWPHRHNTSAHCDLIVVISLYIIDMEMIMLVPHRQCTCNIFHMGIQMSQVLILLVGAVDIQSASIKTLDLLMPGGFFHESIHNEFYNFVC